MPLPTDLVRDPASAIRIAQRACSNMAAHSKTAVWRAHLYGRIWNVSYSEPGTSKFRCPIFAVAIEAVDGKPDECSTVVCVRD
jgi:hypothetical protein